jgi:hypothetical protein
MLIFSEPRFAYSQNRSAHSLSIRTYWVLGAVLGKHSITDCWSLVLEMGDFPFLVGPKQLRKKEDCSLAKRIFFFNFGEGEGLWGRKSCDVSIQFYVGDMYIPVLYESQNPFSKHSGKMADVLGLWTHTLICFMLVTTGQYSCFLCYRPKNTSAF